MANVKRQDCNKLSSCCCCTSVVDRWSLPAGAAPCFYGRALVSSRQRLVPYIVWREGERETIQALKHFLCPTKIRSWMKISSPQIVEMNFCKFRFFDYWTWEVNEYYKYDQLFSTYLIFLLKMRKYFLFDWNWIKNLEIKMSLF